MKWGKLQKLADVLEKDDNDDDDSGDNLEEQQNERKWHC